MNDQATQQPGETQIIRELLSRVDLKGAEVPAYLAALRWLDQQDQQPFPEPVDPVEDI